ncbi:MAG TPA: hypothetical protein VG269_18380 [Tepidisphaeraceae bacterium]|jgi:hypothetical protein|nr:hypothetical protein [Tepidisphaeraceae bacterium]
MTLQQAAIGHSAQVRMNLHLNGHVYPIAQMGGGRMIFDKPVMLPSGTGMVVMQVDGLEQRWRVAVPAQACPQRTVMASFGPV